MNAIVKHWPLVLGITMAVTFGVSLWVLGQTKIYEAKLTLKIEPRALRPLGSDVQTPGDTSSSYWADQEYYETQHKILESRHIAEGVVRVLALHQDLRFLASVRSDAPLPPPPKGKVTVENVAESVRKRLKVEPIRKSRLVELTYSDPDPGRAQRILNTIAQVYKEHTLDSSMSDIGNASAWLHDQLTDLKKELESAEMALHEFKKEKRLLSVSLDDQSNMLSSEMEQLSAALTEARTRREKVASRVAQLRRVDPTDPSDLPASELLDSAALQSLRSKFVSARSDYESMKSSGKGEHHPAVLQAKAAMESTRDALVEEIGNIKESMERDLAATRAEIEGLAGIYAAAEQRAFDLNLLEIDYKRLDRDRVNTNRLYSIVLERSKEGELSGEMRFNNVSVVDTPVRPRAPAYPRVKLTIALGALAGLALGVAFTLLRERMDNRFKTGEDIEAALGLPCLASIPDFDSKEDGKSTLRPRARHRARRLASSDPPELWVHTNPTSGVAESMRTLRTNLTFMAPDHPYRRILVTSANPGEGKTTVATSLAITLAQSGKSVLLIDADLRRPRLSKVFSVQSPQLGVTSVVLDPTSFDQAVYPTSIPNLDLLPTGALPPNPSELLHSASFERLLGIATGRFDRIVIDSPPLIAVSDAAILSRQVDSTVLVVRSMATKKESGKKALRALTDINSVVAGSVLNGVTRSDEAYGYYGYGSTAGEGAA